MKIGITLYDTVDYLDCTEARIEYLRGALEEGDKDEWMIALLNVAKSLGITHTEIFMTCALLSPFETEKLPEILDFVRDQLNKK